MDFNHNQIIITSFITKNVFSPNSTILPHIYEHVHTEYTSEKFLNLVRGIFSIFHNLFKFVYVAIGMGCSRV